MARPELIKHMNIVNLIHRENYPRFTLIENYNCQTCADLVLRNKAVSRYRLVENGTFKMSDFFVGIEIDSVTSSH